MKRTINKSDRCDKCKTPLDIALELKKLREVSKVSYMLLNSAEGKVSRIERLFTVFIVGLAIGVTIRIIFNGF